MSSGIYAVVKKHATSEGTLENHYNDDGFADWHYKHNNHYGIYDKMMGDGSCGIRALQFLLHERMPTCMNPYPDDP